MKGYVDLAGRSVMQMLMAAALAGGIQAQTQNRSFISTTGVDSNPCTHGQPCRTFTRAISQTLSGGEVQVLDSGGYGAFTLSRPMRITAAPGISAAISVPSSFSGIRISNPAGSVSIQGITIQGNPGAFAGIYWTGSGSLNVSDCEISEMPSHGINFIPSGADFVHFEVRDTTIRECGGEGIRIQSNLSFAHGLIDNVTVTRTTRGFFLMGEGTFTVADSKFFRNTGGIYVQGPGPSNTLVRGCIMSNNEFGIQGGGQLAPNNTEVRVSNCSIVHNLGGILSDGGSDVISLGGNDVTGSGLGQETFPATVPKK